MATTRRCWRSFVNGRGFRWQLGSSRVTAFGYATYAREVVDVVQTNVLYVGGYSEGVKVAHFAESMPMPMATGGGWPEHNPPRMGAVANHQGVEMHGGSGRWPNRSRLLGLRWMSAADSP